MIGILGALRRRWAYIFGGVVLGLVGAGGVIWASTPMYTGTAQVFISTPGVNTTATDLAQGNTFTRQQVNTYARLTTTPPVLQPVLDQLDLDMSLGDLTGNVSAAAPVNTALVSVTVRDPDRNRAADITNAVATSLARLIPQLEQAPDGSPAPVRATVVEPAQPPPSPASPNIPLILALGLVLGLAVGVGAALLRDRTDTVVRDQRDISRLSAVPVLGSIPEEPEQGAKPHSIRWQTHTSESEAFRHVRTALMALGGDRRALVVTSSVFGEGTPHVATNLAVVIATAGSRVLLLDADMRAARDRDPEAEDGDDPGLSALLSGRAAFEDVVRRRPDVDNLDVLPAGKAPANPSELLESPRMRQLLDEARGLYDLVLINAPALLPVTDGAVLARLADGVIVVVGRNRVRREDLLEACARLDGVHATPVGFVLNCALRRRTRPSTRRRHPQLGTPAADSGRREGMAPLESADPVGRE